MKIIKENWFRVIVVLLIVFAVYWFGIRPAEIEKGCSIAKGQYAAIRGSTGTPNYPGCEKNPYYNPVFQILDKNATGVPDRDASGSIIQGCQEPLESWPATDWVKPATPAQYDQCLHQNGL
jgi:hypothetical protein